MAKRLFDLVVACVLLIVVAPIMAVCALLVRLSGAGPVLYRARRAGAGGRDFTMLKLRTMHHRPLQDGSRITAAEDPRISRAGRWLRRIHLDELPQLVNVLKGDMSLVGPRPEDSTIVAEHYTPAMRATLAVRPGMTSPGTLFAYTHGDDYLEGHDDPEADYTDNLLRLKLAFELVYIERQSLAYDLRLLARTAALLLVLAFGTGTTPELPELSRALELLPHL